MRDSFPRSCCIDSARFTGFHALNPWPHLSSFPVLILPFIYVCLSPRPVVLKVGGQEPAASASSESWHLLGPRLSLLHQPCRGGPRTLSSQALGKFGCTLEFEGQCPGIPGHVFSVSSTVLSGGLSLRGLHSC